MPLYGLVAGWLVVRLSLPHPADSPAPLLRARGGRREAALGARGAGRHLDPARSARRLPPVAAGVGARESRGRGFDEIRSPVGVNLGAWLFEHAPDVRLTKQVIDRFIAGDERVRNRYLYLFQRSKGRDDRARAAYVDSLRRDPRQPAMHCDYADILVALGDIELAARHYGRALELAPGFEPARAGSPRRWRRSKKGEAARARRTVGEGERGADRMRPSRREADAEDARAGTSHVDRAAGARRRDRATTRHRCAPVRGVRARAFALGRSVFGAVFAVLTRFPPAICGAVARAPAQRRGRDGAAGRLRRRLDGVGDGAIDLSTSGRTARATAKRAAAASVLAGRPARARHRGGGGGVDRHRDPARGRAVHVGDGCIVGAMRLARCRPRLGRIGGRDVALLGTPIAIALVGRAVSGELARRAGLQAGGAQGVSLVRWHDRLAAQLVQLRVDGSVACEPRRAGAVGRDGGEAGARRAVRGGAVDAATPGRPSGAGVGSSGWPRCWPGRPRCCSLRAGPGASGACLRCCCCPTSAGSTPGAVHPPARRRW